MANLTIADLDAATIPLGGNEELELQDPVDGSGRVTVANLAAYLTANVNTWTKPQRSSFTSISSGSAKTWDLSQSNLFTTTMTINATLTPTNIGNGQSGVIYVTQDATGGFTLAYDAAIKFKGGTAPSISTDPNSITIIPYEVESGVVYLLPEAADMKVA